MADLSKIYAFSDCDNDISMFEVVTHFAVMGNANDYVKRAEAFVSYDQEVIHIGQYCKFS